MATRTWVGGAVAIKDKWTITVANTWAGGDTGTVTINGKDLTVTIGALTTTAQVATTIKEAWESGTFTDTTAVASPSGGGTTIGEMSQFTATVSGSTVILTADTAGVEFPAITVSENTAGTGTLSIAHTTTATGPNHWNNTDNWAEGSVPTTGDDVIIDRPVSILYSLDHNGDVLASMTIGQRFTSAAYIGLPFQNSTGSVPYEEGNEDQLKVGITALTCYGSSGRIKINVGTNQITGTIYSTGTSSDTGRAAFQFVGTHASNALTVVSGDVGIAANTGEAATVATLTQTGGTVTCGTSATLTTITKTGGTLTVQSSTTTLLNEAGTLTIRAGTHTTLTSDDGTVTLAGTITVTTWRINGGTVTAGPACTHNSITKTGGSLTLNAGGTTITNSGGALTINSGNITTATINGGSFFYDGTGTITTLRIGNATVTTGRNVTLTTVVKDAGTLTCEAGIGTLTSNSGTTTVNSGNITTANINGGTFEYAGAGTIGTLAVRNCVVDFGAATDACTVTTLTINARPVDIRDPSSRVTYTNGLTAGYRIKFLAA